MEVPLGTLHEPVATRAFTDRDIDVYFAGSVIHDVNRRERWRQLLKRALGNSKLRFRRSMLAATEQLAAAEPAIRILCRTTADFHQVTTDEVDRYGAEIGRSRFCLVPRGDSIETYRFFEAMQAGAIVVSETLPPRWFYDGAPVVALRHWRDLTEALVPLLHDREAQLRLHRATTTWWTTHCSPDAIGRALARRLSALVVGGRPDRPDGRLAADRSHLVSSGSETEST